MGNTKHTPTPWTVSNHSWSRTGIYGDGFMPIATLDISDDAVEENQEALEEQMAANAAFIVRAVNSHEQLVAALRGGLNAIDILMAQLITAKTGFMPTKSEVWPVLLEIKAALDSLAAAEA